MKFLRYRGVCIECKSVWRRKWRGNGKIPFPAIFCAANPARNGDSRGVIARRKTAGALSGKQGARGQKPAQGGQVGWLFAAFEGQHACAPAGIHALTELHHTAGRTGGQEHLPCRAAAAQILNSSRGSFAFGKATESAGFCQNADKPRKWQKLP